MKKLADFAWDGKVALLRADLNVPTNAAGEISDLTRIKAALPTIRWLLDSKAGIVLLSHFGRPQEGKPEAKWSLRPIADKLTDLLETDICFAQDLSEAKRPACGTITMLDNVRLNSGEKAGDAQLASKYAALGDIFVLDAFATAHRTDASLVALGQAAKDSCAGLLLEKEIEMLDQVRSGGRAPLLAIVGGAKISDKIGPLSKLAQTAQLIVVGGGIANTFLAAQGKNVGKSLWEPQMQDHIKQLLVKHPDLFVVPHDVVVAPSLEASSGHACNADDVGPDDMILDIGPSTSALLSEKINAAAAVIWAGAMGVFEHSAFAAGTAQVARTLAQANAFTVAGGGETVQALAKFVSEGRLDYVSTGGTAFLEYMEGKALPAIAALR